MTQRHYALVYEATFKIVTQKYDINLQLFFQLGEGGTRGHDQKLFKKISRLDVRNNASFYHATACNATHSIAVKILSVCQMRVL